jgi:adenylate kinase
MKLKKPFTIVLLGRSGSGKGTQAEFLLPKLKPVIFLQTGKLLRKFIKGRNTVALFARRILSRGDLVPSWLSNHMWADKIIRSLKKENLLLDGSPRRKEEAVLLDRILKDIGRPLSIALYIYLSPREAEKRLLKRGRSDDKPAAIGNRMKFFDKDVLPTISYYKKNKRLITIDGEKSPEKVFGEIKRALNI